MQNKKPTHPPIVIDETWERAAIAVYASLQTLIKTDDRLCAKRAFVAADTFVRELELRKIRATQAAKQGEKP